MSANRPLEGLTIADFSMVYAGPICARLLADAGATVIKVEPLGLGDAVRGTPRIFAHFNAGKRSIQLDLAADAGRSVARSLIARADVVIENFRPGVMERFGLGHETVRATQPELVYCSISGYGQTGPYAQRAAYAPIAHAASGFDVAHLRSQFAPEPMPEDAQPHVSGIMIADMLTGAYAFGAVQTALLGRFRHGQGDHIDASMLESMAMLIPGQIQLAQRPDPARPGGGFPPIRAADGYLMVCVVSDKIFAGLCRAINRPDLRDDPQFVRGERIKHVRKLSAEIEKWSGERSVAECETQLTEHGVPCSPFHAADKLFSHPQLMHRATFATLTDEHGEFLIQNAPYRFADAPNGIHPQVPTPGQHTTEILSELGLDAAAITDLREARIAE